MRRRGVKRSKATGRGVGQCRHCYTKYADLLSTWERKGSVFGFFHPETRFQKSAFPGSFWMISENDAKHLHKKKSVSMWTRAKAPQRTFDSPDLNILLAPAHLSDPPLVKLPQCYRHNRQNKCWHTNHSVGFGKYQVLAWNTGSCLGVIPSVLWARRSARKFVVRTKHDSDKCWYELRSQI